MSETPSPASPKTATPSAAPRWQPQALDAAVAELRLPTPLTQLSPQACQDLALLVARRGLGRVAPNPLVGAVLVDKQQRFLAAGAHERVGHAHAEIAAFAAAEKAGLAAYLPGGTLYVTLEPCAHANRTPACAPVVARSGLSRVVYGTVDPNPKVDGRGAQLLREAGLIVDLATEWTPACRELAEVFFWGVAHATPFVGMKAAVSLDGVLADHGDRRRWITSARARAYGHFLRSSYDAIAIGCGTLLADDPRLDTRDALLPGRAPRRVVFDPHGRGLLAWPNGGWRLLQDQPSQVIWLTGRGPAATPPQSFLDGGGVHLALDLDANDRFALDAVLAALAAEGITSLLLEGGAGLYADFLAARRIQKLHLFQAPCLLGGPHSLHLSAKGQASPPLARTTLTPLAPDLLIEGDWLA